MSQIPKANAFSGKLLAMSILPDFKQETYSNRCLLIYLRQRREVFPSILYPYPIFSYWIFLSAQLQILMFLDYFFTSLFLHPRRPVNSSW